MNPKCQPLTKKGPGEIATFTCTTRELHDLKFRHHVKLFPGVLAVDGMEVARFPVDEEPFIEFWEESSEE